LGVPAVTQPLLRVEGLPLGLQLLGFKGQDAALFSTAFAVRALMLGH
jgi:Asp-tRNA(Asn)/Glu-tRNA(Gln) amidotransferase A subunit family amidase